MRLRAGEARGRARARRMLERRGEWRGWSSSTAFEGGGDGMGGGGRGGCDNSSTSLRRLYENAYWNQFQVIGPPPLSIRSLAPPNLGGVGHSIPSSAVCMTRSFLLRRSPPFAPFLPSRSPLSRFRLLLLTLAAGCVSACAAAAAPSHTHRVGTPPPPLSSDDWVSLYSQVRPVLRNFMPLLPPLFVTPATVPVGAVWRPAAGAACHWPGPRLHKRSAPAQCSAAKNSCPAR
jgi:hypothetical protein